MVKTEPFPAESPHPLTAVSGAIYFNGQSARIFYQHTNGCIHVVTGDGGKFSHHGQVVSASDVKPQTPLVSVLFLRNKGEWNSRTFFLGKNNELRLFCMDNGQESTNALSNGAYVAAPGSKLGAFYWTENDFPKVRVCFQKPDGAIQQVDWDNAKDNFGYVPRGTSPSTLLGTYLAFVNQSARGEPQYFRGFYQHTDNTLMELIDEPSQGYIGTNINGSKAEPTKTAIAASTVPTARKQGHVGVYWVTHGGTLTRCAFSNGQWGSPAPLDVSVREGAGMLAQAWMEGSQLKEVLIGMGNDEKMYLVRVS